MVDSGFLLSRGTFKVNYRSIKSTNVFLAQLHRFEGFLKFFFIDFEGSFKFFWSISRDFLGFLVDLEGLFTFFG